MSKIHPSGASGRKSCDLHVSASGAGKPASWTVWKKSSMAFQGTDGFSVFDCNGRLAFRVDNYSRRNKYFAGELVLMDGDGEALLTLRPQILSIHDRWNGFKGEHGSRTKPRAPLFSLRRRSLFHSNDEVEVFMCSDPIDQSSSSVPDFRFDGCFARRCCKIRCSSSGEVAAEITRKKVNKSVVLGDDVFCLTVHPGFDSELIMAFVVAMDRMCQRPFTPLLCT